MLKENKFEDYRDDKSSAGTTNTNPIREGQPMGGQNFGKNNNTPAGDDKNNPSQNAGYSNAYFARTEPLEEHPEDTNFKAPYQDGEPDYSSAQPYAQEQSDQTGNIKPSSNSSYTEGTADDETEDH
ncbi:MAG: hypothetical protein ABI367_14405 [Mucilaginibacter sp.]